MRLLACVSFRTVRLFLSFLWFHDPPRHILLICAAHSEEALPSTPIPTIRPLALVAMTGRPADIFHLQGEVLCLTVYLFADRM